MACADAAGLDKEVVVRILRVVVDARLELEHGDREDRRLAVAEPLPDGAEHLADDDASGEVSIPWLMELNGTCAPARSGAC